MEETRTTYESTLKSLDTEEYIDLKFYRPLGYRWALLFRRLHISPNAVTIASIFIGVAAGIMFYYNNLLYNVVGMLLLIWANTFDSADGQLARMTGNYSRLGRILDGMSGDLWFATIYIALCLRLMNDGWTFSVFFLAAIAGYFHAKQASMADYYRNFHLFFLKGKSGSELDDSAQLMKNYRSTPWKRHFFSKLVQWFYISYTEGQEVSTPAMQQFRIILREKYGDTVPAWIREQFREKSLPLMKYTNMLSFNTRVIFLFFSLCIGQVWLYFIFELTVLNGMLFYMIAKHESICRYFIRKISERE